MPFQNDPKPPTTGSGVKPPPPSPDQWWDLNPSRKVDHTQFFNSKGEQTASSFWQSTGRYRIRVGWFGWLIVEEEMAFVEEHVGTPPYIYVAREWRRAPRRSIITFRDRAHG